MPPFLKPYIVFHDVARKSLGENPEVLRTLEGYPRWFYLVWRRSLCS